MMNRVAAVSYYFILELILGILFLFLFYINKNELPPILLLAVLSISSIILFFILLTKFSGKGKWLYFATIGPLLVVVGNQSGLPLFMCSVLGLFVFWRGFSLYEDVSEHSKVLLLLWSFLIGLAVIIYAAMSAYPYQSQIILLLISQILLVLIGDFYRKWNSLNKDKSKFAVYFVKILAGFTVIGVALTFILKYVQLVFFGLLHLFVLLFTWIMTPFFKLIPYLLSLNGKGQRNSSMQASEGLNDPEKYQDQSYLMTQNILSVLLFLTIGAIIFYLIYKKKIKLQILANNPTTIVEISGEFGSNQSPHLRKRGKPPEDIIRREIFELEGFAQKLKLGRFPFETLEEWWQRVGIMGTNEAIEIYEKVRYGGAASSKDEQFFIKAEIRRLKQQLKEIRKGNKR